MTLLQKLLKRAFNLIRLFCLCRRYRRKLLTFRVYPKQVKHITWIILLKN